MADTVLTHSWQKGGIARLKVELRALEKRVEVSLPVNPDCRYDMIVDQCGKLFRVQIKYAGECAPVLPASRLSA